MPVLWPHPLLSHCAQNALYLRVILINEPMTLNAS